MERAETTQPERNADGTVSFTVSIRVDGTSNNKPLMDEACQAAMEWLRPRQIELAEKYRLGVEKWPWRFDQTSCHLRFVDEQDRTRVLCDDVVIAGSYSSFPSTWMWGWKNASLKASLTEPVKAAIVPYVDAEVSRVSWPQLLMPMQPCGSEADAWGYAALACRAINGTAVYRGPTGQGGGAVYFIVRSIRML